MMPFLRPLFALLMMALVVSALILATLGWVESHPDRRVSVNPTVESKVLESVRLAEREALTPP